MGMMYPKPKHGRLVPKQGKRGEFSKLTRDIILERDDKRCFICNAPAQEIHHVRFKSQGGRGVVTNGIGACTQCHREIHDNPEMAYALQRYFENKYGPDYYKDQFDD